PRWTWSARSDRRRKPKRPPSPQPAASSRARASAPGTPSHAPTGVTAMLDADLKAQLAGYMQRLVQPIELVAALDDSDASRELEALVRDIASSDDRITVRADDDPTVRRPSFAIVRTGTDVSVRFAAIPMGHEFTSLVLALLQVGGHPVKVEEELADQVR